MKIRTWFTSFLRKLVLRFGKMEHGPYCLRGKVGPGLHFLFFKNGVWGLTWPSLIQFGSAGQIP